MGGKGLCTVYLGIVGAQMVGQLPPVGIFREGLHEPEWTPEELLASAPEWHDELMGLPEPSAEKVEAILRKSEKEQSIEEAPRHRSPRQPAQ